MICSLTLFPKGKVGILYIDLKFSYILKIDGHILIEKLNYDKTYDNEIKLRTD